MPQTQQQRSKRRSPNPQPVSPPAPAKTPVPERIPEPGPANADWLIWQLADSSFPIGGFAHSAGLEAAWQHGEVPGREALAQFVEASLAQQGRAGLPFVWGAFDQPDQVAAVDRLCEAFTVNHVANRASRAQGRAFLSAVGRIFKEAAGELLAEGTFPCGHFAPAFGASLRRLGVARETAGRMFLFNHLRGVLAAAVRLNIVGPMEAQVLTRQLARQAELVMQASRDLTTDDIAQTAPLLDLWQGAQDRLYSRLFQS